MARKCLWIRQGRGGLTNYRSRLVVKERKKAMKISDDPSPAELFSGMPSLESSNASSGTNCVPPPLLGFSEPGTPQTTSGTISTSMQETCVLWMALRACQRCRRHEVVIERFCRASGGDTGATEHVRGPHDFTHVELLSEPRPALKTATGELLKHTDSALCTSGVKAKSCK